VIKQAVSNHPRAGWPRVERLGGQWGMAKGLLGAWANHGRKSGPGSTGTAKL